MPRAAVISLKNVEQRDKYGYPALIFSQKNGLWVGCWLIGWILLSLAAFSQRDRVAQTIVEAPHESGGILTRQLDPRVRSPSSQASGATEPTGTALRSRGGVAGDGPRISRRLECFVVG